MLLGLAVPFVQTSLAVPFSGRSGLISAQAARQIRRLRSRIRSGRTDVQLIDATRLDEAAQRGEHVVGFDT